MIYEFGLDIDYVIWLRKGFTDVDWTTTAVVNKSSRMITALIACIAKAVNARVFRNTMSAFDSQSVQKYFIMKISLAFLGTE